MQTKDSGGLTFEKSFAIYVNDLNEHPSSALASNLSFNWWISGGSLVSAWSSTDQDSGDTHSYALVSGDGDTDNTLFKVKGMRFMLIL